MPGIFNASIFNNAIFNTDSAQQAAVVVSTASPAGRARRRRYLMPDGTRLDATTEEAFEWLRLYSKPKPEVAIQAPPRSASIRMPAIVLEKRDVRFIPATDSLPDTWRAVISERFSYQPPPEVTRQAEIIANRMRANEEAIALLMLL